MVDYDRAEGAVQVDLMDVARNTGNAAGDTYVPVENVTGTSSADDLRGDAANNRLVGLAGEDTLFGRDGDDALRGDDGEDHLRGGDGSDFLRGGTGADELDGGAGIDQAQYTDAEASVTADLAGLVDNAGDAAGDTSLAIENLSGSDHGDDLRGDDAANQIAGLAGDDRLYGRGGDDRLLGGAGHDHLDAGAGDDVLAGHAGDDWLRGQGGADQFVIENEGGFDVIDDFVQGVDRIEFAIDGVGYADLAFSLYEDGELRGVMIDYGSDDDTLLIRNNTIQTTDLSETDFVFT